MRAQTLPDPRCSTGSWLGPQEGFFCISVPFAHTYFPLLTSNEVQFVGGNLSYGGEARFQDTAIPCVVVLVAFSHPFGVGVGFFLADFKTEMTIFS